ncbi:hypothetical protein ACWGE1_29250, partial [Streptomyces sp. NPDC054932]
MRHVRPGPGRRRLTVVRDPARAAPRHRPHGVRGARGRAAGTEAGTAGMTANEQEPQEPQERANALRQALATRVVVADGAMGTMLQAQDPSMEDFQQLEGCN